MKRAFLAGFVIGWCAYMIAMILTVYDGLASLLFQPVIAAVFGALAGAAAMGVAAALRAARR